MYVWQDLKQNCDSGSAFVTQRFYTLPCRAVGHHLTTHHKPNQDVSANIAQWWVPLQQQCHLKTMKHECWLKRKTRNNYQPDGLLFFYTGEWCIFIKHVKTVIKMVKQQFIFICYCNVKFVLHAMFNLSNILKSFLSRTLCAL